MNRIAANIANVSASRNVCVGVRAGYTISTCTDNVFVGYYAGSSNTTGYLNTFVGKDAGESCTTGNENTFIGNRAGEAVTTATANNLLGNTTGRSITTGYGNNFFGGECGIAITTGQRNVGMGNMVLTGVTTGDRNIGIGSGAGGSSSPSGNITTGDNNICLGDNNITNLYCADTSISSSDQRDKTDVTSFTIGLNWIEALRPITYRWDRRTWYGTDEQPYGTPDGSKKRSKLHIGFLAQEALAVEQANGYGADNDNSLAVHLNEDGMSYGMKYERLVPILVNAIKELSTRVQALEAG